MIFKGKIPLYRMKVTYTDSSKEFNKITGCELDPNYSGGGTYRCNDVIYIYLPMDGDGYSSPDLAHESFHAADFVCEYVGAEYKYGSGNEHVAYLVTFFVEFIMDCGVKIQRKNNGR